MGNNFIILICIVCATLTNMTGIAASESINGGKMEEFILIGKMKAKPNCEAMLEDVLQTLSVGTYTESGCIFYALHRDAEDPSVFVLIEGWASKEALQMHFNAPHFLQQFPILSSLIVGDPELTCLTPLGQGKKGSLLITELDRNLNVAP